MLALPLIPPPADDSSPWHSDVYIPRSDSPPLLSSNATAQAQAHNRQQRQQRDEEKRLQQARSPAVLLAQDEAAIAHRKAAIRNFGAYWIRPPGISKTLQATIEEEVERREQEEIERQEQGLRDLQAQQQLEEAQQRAAETAEQDDGAERDLDDDVPEAEPDVTFNEGSMLEDSHVAEENEYDAIEVAELTGIARDEENLGIEHERDLDDSVAEAESYADTDSDESEDAIAILNASYDPPAHGMAQRLGNAGGLFGRTQMLQRAQAAGLPRSPGSMVLSSPQVESSFAASSPVRPRNTARHNRQHQ